MPTYITANLTVTDPSWVAEYGPAVHALVTQHGGRYVAQTPEVTRLEGDGDTPSVSVILEFPNRASAEAWYHDAAYKPWLEARQSGSHGDVLMFDSL